MKKLPIGIQTFSEIRTNNFVYVDKTKIALNLIENGKYYFLSRPRRFGKSLFLDTLKNIFMARKELFTGLYIQDKYNWGKSYPVISISFAGGVTQSRSLLDEIIMNQIDSIASDFSVDVRFNNISDRFQDLIRRIYHKYDQRVVILVDEYDKPILDNITAPEVALDLREGLKNYYSVIKACDQYVRFVFLTGVSKFSKVSLFSGLNNLQDITLDKRYATICGYTQGDLERQFKEYLPGCDLGEIKKWYNGYNWFGENVYNPFDILLFFANDKEYRNYWFETGTPSFLINLLQLKKYYIPGIEKIKASDEILGSFDIENIHIETLLFQTGYVTILKKRKIGAKFEYILNYPNLEVKHSINDYMLTQFSKDAVAKQNIQSNLYDILLENDLDGLKNIVFSFFASIPNDWYRKNRIAEYEGYYASVFYSYFASLGLDVTPEDATNHGKIDMTLQFNNFIYIFEFKVIELVKDDNSALQQINDKRYHEKYSDHKDIYLIGIEFSKKDRNITRYEWEKVNIHKGTFL
jgi:hypothetical protein